MAWTEGLGWNFRESSVYVTDGARDQYIGVGNMVYPLTTHGSGETVTYGFPSNPGEGGGIYWRNRSTTPDIRFAGDLGVQNAATTDTFALRVDLPNPGTYRVRLAMGSRSGSSKNYWRILDDATQRGLVDNSGTLQSAGHFADAAGTIHTSEANWISNNAAVDYVFSSTIFRLELAVPGTGTDNDTRITHLQITEIAASGPEYIRMRVVRP
jgi:hypothetical protein